MGYSLVGDDGTVIAMDVESIDQGTADEVNNYLNRGGRTVVIATVPDLPTQPTGTEGE